MSNINIKTATNCYVGDHGVLLNTLTPQDVTAAFKTFRQSAGPALDARTEEEFTSLERELTAEQPSRDRILSRIRVLTAAAGATGAIGKAAEALSAAVHSWL